jgi:mannose-6-phosphate isomerase-like protein (cupin superfamily)
LRCATCFRRTSSAPQTIFADPQPLSARARSAKQFFATNRQHGQECGQVRENAEKLNHSKGYLIALYQPMAYVELHAHKVQEQIYHVLEGEGLMDIDGKKHVVRKHDVIYLPPGVTHAMQNSGLVDLVFLVVTSPVTDEAA